MAWSADTPIKVGIKRRLYLVGIGLVCGTEGAETEYLNAGDYAAASPVDCVHYTPEAHRSLGLAIARKVREMLDD